MQCCKIGMPPSSVPANEMYDVSLQFGGGASGTSVGFSPPLFTQDRITSETVMKSPLMTAHLRLLDAGVPAHLLWDESDRKMIHVVFFTTPEIATNADSVIKDILSSQDFECLSLP